MMVTQKYLKCHFDNQTELETEEPEIVIKNQVLKFDDDFFKFKFQ